MPRRGHASRNWRLVPFRSYTDLCNRWGEPPAGLDANVLRYIYRGLTRERNQQSRTARNHQLGFHGGWMMARNFLGDMHWLFLTMDEYVEESSGLGNEEDGEEGMDESEEWKIEEWESVEELEDDEVDHLREDEDETVVEEGDESDENDGGEQNSWVWPLSPEAMAGDPKWLYDMEIRVFGSVEKATLCRERLETRGGWWPWIVDLLEAARLFDQEAVELTKKHLDEIDDHRKQVDTHWEVTKLALSNANKSEAKAEQYQSTIRALSCKANLNVTQIEKLQTELQDADHRMRLLENKLDAADDEIVGLRQILTGWEGLGKEVVGMMVGEHTEIQALGGSRLRGLKRCGDIVKDLQLSRDGWISRRKSDVALVINSVAKDPSIPTQLNIPLVVLTSDLDELCRQSVQAYDQLTQGSDETVLSFGAKVAEVMQRSSEARRRSLLPLASNIENPFRNRQIPSPEQSSSSDDQLAPSASSSEASPSTDHPYALQFGSASPFIFPQGPVRTSFS
ncbi:hypothetical protein OQA88_13661 [Cercophora sp. LCS_1]